DLDSLLYVNLFVFFFFQAEDGIRDLYVTGVRRVLFRSSVPYSFRAVSAATGNMLASVEDEYTYFASGSPRVTNALVVLSDALSQTAVLTNYTGPDGTILFTNLTEAYYLVDIGATNHSSFRQTALVAAGATTNVVA